MGNPIREDYLKVVRHEIPSRVPVAIYNAAPFTTAFTGTDINAYYRNPDLKMAAQLKLLELLPGILTIPPLWADYGPVLECSAFGSEILWQEHDPPFVKPAIWPFIMLLINVLFVFAYFPWITMIVPRIFKIGI
jgi:uroporphyrinogen decarboxylase